MGEGWGSAGKIFCYHVATFWIPFNRYATIYFNMQHDHVLKMVFDLDPTDSVGDGSAGKIFASMLLHA